MEHEAAGERLRNLPSSPAATDSLSFSILTQEAGCSAHTQPHMLLMRLQEPPSRGCEALIY